MKCNCCGCTDIDVDPSRGDAVCTNCGSVLESNIIVSDIQFEENAHGGASAIGQFVSTDSKGGGSFGGVGRSGGGPGYGQITSALGRESRETTLRNARKKIEALAQQLSLRRDRIDMAFHFYKLALARNLTRGRKHTHVIAACLYITCRTEGTSHMLIDFSDVLQIDVYELGRTYLRLSQALCINIPAMDPCLYVMRFAHKLELADKTHEVSMTALRLVSRMKKDWIHFGRRPSGLCGAALLIAARLHMFNRTIDDIVKVVKLHESTLRKRLNEFGATTTAMLTLDEFATVDLDSMTEEEDPPSFKAARKKDKERLQKLEMTGILNQELSELELKIESELEKLRAKQLRRSSPQKIKPTLSGTDEISIEESLLENRDAEDFITQQTLGVISEIVQDANPERADTDRVLMPPPKSDPISEMVGLKGTIQEYLSPTTVITKESSDRKEIPEEDGELDLTDIDETEIDGYLMSQEEIEFKTIMWMRMNADYLKEKSAKEERERQEREEAEKEGKTLKKKVYKKKTKSEKGPNQTAIEAIEKIVQEKKISTKINYDVLKSLSMPLTPKSNYENSETGRIGKSSSIFGESPLPSPANASAVFSPSWQDSNPLGSPLPLPLLKRTTPVKKVSSSPLSQTKPLQIKSDPVVKDSSSPDAKRLKLCDEREVVIEDGPLQVEPATPSAPVEENPDDEDLDDDEEDESCLTASQLLRKHRADEFEEEEFDDEYY